MRDPVLLDALDALVVAIAELDVAIDTTTADVDQLIECWWWIDHPADGDAEGGSCQRLNVLRDAVKAKIAPIMASAGETTRVTDLGVVHQSKPPKPKGFDNERLVRDVLDSRIIDSRTGEVMDETPYEKITMVWNLAGGTARKTALSARGLDILDYAEDPNWQPATVRWAR